ncbi:DUF222 domain-containing protein [Pseudokineococcus basanitobsidens]|uniref:DUF222 domain-containing protein n=1 Tax=Pseudokineococcus basanitobsidens TaxID=1926649 RepID=A0ABU8RLR5_9ACTN
MDDDAAGDASGGVPVARRRAAALVGALVDQQAVRARSYAATLTTVADLVEQMSAPGGPTAPLAGSATGPGPGAVTDPSAPGGGVAARRGRASTDAARSRRRVRARLARAYATGDPVEATTAEVATALRMATSAAARLVDDALALTTDLPTTLAALEQGITTEAHARVVAAGTSDLDAPAARWVDAHLTAEDLTRSTPAELRARLAHLSALADPHQLSTRTRADTCARAVHLAPLPHGMAQLTATGPALDLAACFDVLTAVSRDRGGPHGHVDPHAAAAAGLDVLTAAATPDAALPDRRGADARRFDALVDLLAAPAAGAAVDRTGTGDVARPAHGAHPGRCHGPQVVVAMTSLLGLDHEPAHLAGVGPVPATQLAARLRHHPYRRAFTDPVTGQLVALDGHLTRPTGTPGTTAVETVALPALLDHLDAPGTTTAAGRTRPGTLPTHTELLDATSTPTTSTGTTSTETTSTGTTSGSARSGTDRARAAASGGRRRPLAPVVPGAPDQPAAPPGSPGAPPGTTVAPPGNPVAPPGTPLAQPGTPAAPPPPTDPPRATAARRPTGGRDDCPVTAAGGGPYTPSTATARHVRDREPRCAFPGCRVPATRCDLDHLRSYAGGGPTCPCNLHPLCRRHHLAKHRFGWRVEHRTDNPADTSLTWTSPTGRSTTTRPHPLLPTRPGDVPRPDEARPTSEVAGDDAVSYPTDDGADDDVVRTRGATEPARRRAAPAQEHRRPAAHPSRPRSSWSDDAPPPPF